MSDTLLQSAVDALQVKNIGLFNSHCELADQFLPLYDPSVNILNTQFKHLVTRTEQIIFTDDEGNNTNLLRFHIEFGARFVSSDMEEQEADQLTQKALIEATFVAEYELKDENLVEEAIQEFALKNVSFQVWPYWREFLTSTCERMNLPRITLPLMCRAQNCPG